MLRIFTASVLLGCHRHGLPKQNGRPRASCQHSRRTVAVALLQEDDICVRLEHFGEQQRRASFPRQERRVCLTELASR